MPITIFSTDDDEDRVDGRELDQPREPGSDERMSDQAHANATRTPAHEEADDPINGSRSDQ